MVSPVFALLFIFALAVNAETRVGCTADGMNFMVGEQYDIPGYCYSNVCSEDGTWSMMACGLVRARRGWEWVPEDVSKPYPECCGHYVAPEN